MFCPSCGAEYRAGFTVCADCDVPLVVEPPALEREAPREVELERVFVSANPALVAMAKSLLDAAGIEYVTSGEGRPFELETFPVRIAVLKEQAAEAVALLEDLESVTDLEDEDEDPIED